MNQDHKQLVELGTRLKADHRGELRSSLKNRLRQLRGEAEQRLVGDLSREEKAKEEALMRAIMVAERILDKVFITTRPDMTGESRFS